MGFSLPGIGFDLLLTQRASPRGPAPPTSAGENRPRGGEGQKSPAPWSGMKAQHYKDEPKDFAARKGKTIYSNAVRGAREKTWD